MHFHTPYQSSKASPVTRGSLLFTSIPLHLLKSIVFDFIVKFNPKNRKSFLSRVGGA